MAKNMYQKREERKNKKMNEDGKSFSNVSINWYPGHMAKTKREIKGILETIDVVIELVDSRIPLSSHVKDMDEIIKDKKMVIVFNKYDLCDKKRTDEFIKYYENKSFKVITCNSKSTDDYKKIIKSCEEAMTKVNSKRKEKGLLPKKVKCLIIGVPNVGKSTLINKIVNKKVANVGNKPGVTKNLSTIRINDKIDLVDSPGILWPKLDTEELALNLACMGIIKEEVLPIDKVAVHILKKLYERYPEILRENLGIKAGNIDDIIEIYDEISSFKNIKYLNDEIDYDRVSTFILNLIKTEKIKNITFD